MPNVDDIIWAAITFRDITIIPGAWSYNQAYLNTVGNDGFLKKLRYHPQELNINDVRNIFVEFLNKWGCRLRNYDNVTATNLRNHIVNVHPELLPIQNYSILDFDLDISENRERVEHIFNSFWSCGSPIARNFGPTATSKVLHIINPRLFIMWDDAIRLHYWMQNNEIIDSGRGYIFFLIETKRITARLVEECKERFNTTYPASLFSETLIPLIPSSSSSMSLIGSLTKGDLQGRLIGFVLFS